MAIGPHAVIVALAALAAAGCESYGEDIQVPELPAATAEVDVAVVDAGFVSVGGERQPVEAFVLSMRQRARAMTAEARGGLRVSIRLEPVDDAADLGPTIDLIMGNLQIMGIVQPVSIRQP